MNADHDAPRDRRPSVEDVRLTWSFEAPAHRLFEAWSDADQYRRWAWGQLGSGTEATVECRVGGQYRVSTKRPDGGAWSFWGEFLECVPNERLVYTVNWTAPMGYESSGETVEVVVGQTPCRRSRRCWLAEMRGTRRRVTRTRKQANEHEHDRHV
ncbi:MAG: SRPBCC family protein [Planctomycetota bacterium]